VKNPIAILTKPRLHGLSKSKIDIVHRNDGLVDIMCLFPTTGFSMDRLPTVETLCSAVAKLAAEGVVSIYNISLDSTPVLVLRPAVYDDLNAAAAEMRTD